MSIKVLYRTHGVATGGFGLVADLEARVGGLSQADVEKLVSAAHQVCPYSNATRGNLAVGLKVTVL